MKFSKSNQSVRRQFTISDFASRVYALTARIPRGKVSTYQAIARAMKRPLAVRAVGNALHHNPFAPKVPCHRVVRSDGTLGGFASGARRKKALLAGEGVSVQGGRVNLERYFYGF